MSEKRENVNNDLQESDKNYESAQLEDNHKINICLCYIIGIKCKCVKNFRHRQYK